MENAPFVVYASFWKRLNAYGWDSLIILGMTLLFSVTSSFAQTAQDIQALVDAGLLPPGADATSLLQSAITGGTSNGSLFSFQDMIMPILISAVYNIAFVAGEWQATPGKRFSGIKVTMADGTKPSLLDSAARHVASGVSLATCWIGFLTIFFTKEKTALHDMICNTRVERVNS